MLTDYFFWFAQPSSILNQSDRMIGMIFAVLFVLGILGVFGIKLLKHQVARKLAKKFFNLFWVVGMSGGLWFALRYENTPIFAKRFWAGLVIIGGLVWLVFILKYLIFNFRSEKVEFDREQLKNKYIPGRR